MKAFTLVELLVTVTIIGLIAGLSIPAISQAIQSGKKAKEIAALKSLIIAYNTYSADNGGQLLKSYDLNGSALDINGNPIGGEDSHEAHRWPWRLAPYFNYGFYSTTHVNDIESYIKSQGGLSQTYLVSVIPSFGLSLNCGGNDYEGSKTKATIATHANQVAKPSQFIAFISSRSMAVGRRYEGFYYVEQPKGSLQYDAKGNPKSTGYISARYNFHAVVAFLGGNVSIIPYKDFVTNKSYWTPEN